MFDSVHELGQVVTHWLGTYFLHSTLLLVAAWLIVRIVRLASGSRELLWKVALVGSLATATAQVGLGVDPLFGSVAVGSQAMQADGAPAAAEPSAAKAAIAELLAVSSVLGSADLNTPAAAPATTATPGQSVPWQSLVAGLWLFVALGMLAWQARNVLVLRRRLVSRQPITGGPLHEMMSGLTGTRSVKLSMSDEVGVPIAFGTLRGEICLPSRAVTDLSVAYQRTMLAHELAHLRRRDPLWRLALTALQSVLFFQPLLRVANRKLTECSELACDEWAARETREPLALAGCITEVARWMVPPVTAPVASMAHRGSELRGRIERLVGQAKSERSLPIWSLGALAVVLVAVVLVAPGLSNAAAAGPRTGLDQVMLAQAPAKDAAKDKTTKSPAKPRKKAKSPAKMSKPPRTAEEKRVQRELEKAMRQLMVEVKRDVQTSVDRAAIKKELDKARAEIRQQLSGQNGSLQKELAEARKEIAKARKEVQAEMKNLKVAGMDPAAIGKMVELSLDMAEKAMPSDKELGTIIESSLKLAEKSIPSDGDIDAIVDAALKAADVAIDKDLGAGLDDMSVDEMRRALQEIREETKRLKGSSTRKPGKSAK